MLRMWISICLIFSTLAGPGLCCCTTSRLLAILPGTTPRSLSGEPSCCCQANSKDGREEPGALSHPSGRTCRCHAKRPPVLPSPVAKVIIDSNWSEWLNPAVTASSFLLAIQNLAANNGALAPPGSVLTAQDILCALHILRC
jgi:hypothetical protein